jgi:hypothetical protein
MIDLATFCCRWLGNHSFHRCQLKDSCDQAFSVSESLSLQILPPSKSTSTQASLIDKGYRLRDQMFYGKWLGNHPFYPFSLKDSCARAFIAPDASSLKIDFFLGIIACRRKKCTVHRIFHGAWLGNHP